MATSIREYAILYVNGTLKTGGATVVGGGNVVLASPVHALNGPEHTGQLPVERLSTVETDMTLVLAPDGALGVAFRADPIEGLLTAETDATLVLAPDGAGGVEFRAETDGGFVVEDEGTPLTGDATALDFVGAGVVASGTGATKTITITGGGQSTDPLARIYVATIAR